MDSHRAQRVDQGPSIPPNFLVPTGNKAIHAPRPVKHHFFTGCVSPHPHKIIQIGFVFGQFISFGGGIQAQRNDEQDSDQSGAEELVTLGVFSGALGVVGDFGVSFSGGSRQLGVVCGSKYLRNTGNALTKPCCTGAEPATWVEVPL